MPYSLIFRLIVTDNQGAKTVDAASLTVKPPENLKYQVELTLNIDMKNFKRDMELTTLKRLELLLNDGDGQPIRVLKINLDSHYSSKRLEKIKITLILIN